MKIHAIASSSKGNAILVDDGITKLLLDAGLRFKELQKKCPCKISEVDAVLISHEHGDHVKAVPDLLKRGKECYASEGTWGALVGGLPRWPRFPCYHKLSFEVGTFKIIPFNVKHDANQPFGYMGKSRETNKRFVYIVDSGVVYFDFKGITHWLLEANHYEAGIKNADLDERVKERILRNHMSFERLSQFMKESDLSKTEQIHLLHLSNGNSNERKFVQDLQRQTGVPVYVH
jgi:phosphoribosyl 1,2-cyclic phosphodiesterase